jgi:superfamily II DNA or RNA helicase
MPFRADSLTLATSTLREAQAGALHAIAAHRSTSDESAQIVLPTGVGKTLVAVLAPYVLEAERVLVVTPARIVRDQVAYEFAELAQAIDNRALLATTPHPELMRVDHRCTRETWELCRERDVVVGTPMVLSHGNEGVDPVPRDLFDLVIFDEAHHLPATTWTTLHERLRHVPTVLLTATPFRNDKQRLPGDIAYAYPLRRAIARGVYQPVSFVPVTPAQPAERDDALARAAVARLRAPEHRAAQSRLLVRTDTKAHADELIGVYARRGAQVATVLDRTSGRTVRAYLKRMTDSEHVDELDGLVVVGAMTEGFDFPRLKVAAYHHPHRTLGPTLQFIGRLARAGDVSGELVAFAEDVSEETALLYREDAVWEELLPAMVDSSVDDEQRVRRFAKGLTTYDPAVHHVPALAIAPSRMTHVYRLADAPDLNWSPDSIAGGEVIERYQHPEHQLLALITRHQLHPRFLRRDMLDSYEHFLHVATWVADPGVLFVSTELASALKDMRLAIAGGRASPVDAVDLAKLLLAADLERCFSVGTRPNTLGGATNESYRMSAGPNAQQTITPADARAYVLGHVMGRRRGSGAGSGTFGFSSGKAKLWEPKPTGSLAEFREWCVGHAAVLAADARTAAPGSRLALLQLPDRLVAFPDSPSVAIMPAELLTDRHILRIENEPVDPLEVIPATRTASADALDLELAAGERRCAFRFRVDGSVEATDGTSLLVDRTTGEVTELADFLENHPPTVMFGDGSVVTGPQIYKQSANTGPLPPEARVVHDWTSADLSVEFFRDATIALTPTNSVAGATLALLEGEADWIVQDHLPGEMADFIAIRNPGGIVHVDLVHCKKPGGANAATRVTDIEELLAQAMRSVYLVTSGPQFWSLLVHRLHHRDATRVVRGTHDTVVAAAASWASSPPIVDWSITAVQPGVADSSLDDWSAGNALMSAAYAACRGQGVAFRLVDAP